MIHLRQAKLIQQELREIVWAVARSLKPHRLAVATLRQFTLQCAPQVIDFFVIDKQLAVACQTKRVTT